MTTPSLLSDLESDEGLRLTAYPDPLTHAEPYTIGYGHTGPDVYPGLEWSQNQASIALAQDVATVSRELDQYLSWWRSLNDPRQDVLAEMGFNLGVGTPHPARPHHGGLLAFTDFLGLVQTGKYSRAGLDLLGTEVARELPARYRRLAKQMSLGVHA